MYRVLYPQRCTLSLTPSRGIWVIDQLKAACNVKPRPETERMVMDWLRSSRIVHRPGHEPGPPASGLL